MKALILAAGYATRLHPLTLNKPKPLLPLGKRLVIEHIIDCISQVKEISEILVITNQKFFSHFRDWQKSFRSSKKIEILNDRTVSNQGRLGTIKDIELVIREKKLSCDLLIVAGDNLFTGGLVEFVKFSQQKIPAVSIGLYDLGDRKLMKKFGVVEIDRDNRIIDFQEKPALPKSSLAAKCLYFFPKHKLRSISRYPKENKIKDAPGYYIEWLAKHEQVFGFVFGGKWYDIGDITSYRQAKQAYQEVGDGHARPVNKERNY